MKLSGNFNVKGVKVEGLKDCDISWEGLDGSWSVEMDVREFAEGNGHVLNVFKAFKDWARNELPDTIRSCGNVVIELNEKDRKLRRERRVPEAEAFVAAKNVTERTEEQIKHLREQLAMAEAKLRRMEAMKN